MVGIPTPGQADPSRPFVAGSARRARAFRRLRARLSSADSPPQTPSSWRESMAQLRQSSMTSQRRQTALASSVWMSAGPVLPMGKNNSGSKPRQAARSRHVIRIMLLVSRWDVRIRESTSAAHWCAHGWSLKVSISVNAKVTAKSTAGPCAHPCGDRHRTAHHISTLVDRLINSGDAGDARSALRSAGNHHQR